MADVEQLLREYIEAHRADPSSDPRPFLDQAEGLDRHELTAMIDGYLTRAPRRPWSADAYAASGAAALVDQLDRSLQGQAGLWPAVLPRLRDRAKLRRGELVKRLAAALGVESREEKVASYYHEMEQGLLSAEGVSQRVLDALATIVGGSAEALRRAGRALPPGEGPVTDAVYARTAFDAAAPAAEAPAARAATPAEEWDEVDRLFRGG